MYFSVSPRASQARKVHRVLKEWKARSAPMANLELRVHQVRLAHRVRSVGWGHQECRDLQVKTMLVNNKAIFEFAKGGYSYCAMKSD